MKKLSLIVPCYNESAVLRAFYEETTGVLNRLDGFEWELIFADDGSTDDTIRIIAFFAKNDARVKYVSFSRNFGKEAAMLAGLKGATGDYVGFIDADLQHSPELIPEMLAAVDGEGFDVAACRRADRTGEKGMKSALSAGFYKVANKISDTYIDEGAQDYRIFNRKVADAILAMPEHNRFTKGIFPWVGFNTKWFVHENRERVAGTSKWSLLKLVKYAFDGILGYTDAPLKLPLVFGVGFTVLSVIYLIITLVLNAVKANFGFTSCFIIFLIMFIGGLLLLSVGIAGEYIARIYAESKARPQYLIKYTNIDSLI